MGEPIYIATKWALVGLGGALRKEARTPACASASSSRESWIRRWSATPLEGAAELAARQSLNPQDVARAVIFVLEQPAHVNIDELVISPLAQEL